MASFVSKPQICNMALSYAGWTETTIGNLDTDTGKAANQCRIHYDQARRFVLADHYWNFATKRQALAEINDAPSDWLYRYDYPDDCLLMQSIQRPNRNTTPIKYKIEQDTSGSGASVLSDEPNAIGIYTRDVEDTRLFSPMFVTSFAYYLASQLSIPMSGDQRLHEANLTIYRNYMASAQATDSNEGEADNELQSPWERARLYGDENGST